MISLEEFRESYINEDINAEAMNTSRHPVEVFIDNAADILINDYCLVGGMEQCYFELARGSISMHIDAAYLDLPSNTLNLLIADYNTGDIRTITNTFISAKRKNMLSYIEQSLKGFFVNGELADPAVQLARDIRANITSIARIHLFIVSTEKLSSAVKDLKSDDFEYQDRSIPVVLDILDIERIYRSKLAGFQKEDIVISCEDYGIRGIPCIKADIETDQYDSYLAIVPGEFLSSIYKKYSSSLLESNVRSFLKFNGGVNKGIRGTILNEKARFFTYNNGISTTASTIEVEQAESGLLIKSFTNLQIINGGQTTATLAATSIKNNADLSGIYVQMKLTVLRQADAELIRNIATYANSQNKVKTADLNSSHPYYVRIEEFSRKIYAPLESGQIVQHLWYFERTRGQYEQPLMQMTKRQSDDYKQVRPKSKKFTLTDLAKYENASSMLPHYVSWGGEVNASHFHANMKKQWEKDNSFYSELYFKELIGKKILYERIGVIISNQEWYQEKRAYRPQLMAYTFSKLAYEAKKVRRVINYRLLWDFQSVPESLDDDISRIAKLIFDTIYDENRPTANIETYCKREECWLRVQKKDYKLSGASEEILISVEERDIEETRARKSQKQNNEIADELSIFNSGADYWNSLLMRGKAQGVINPSEERTLLYAIKYCKLEYFSLSQKQIKGVNEIVLHLREAGIT